jgi:RNA polymerase sigma-70 factor (ECF subfamily)
MVPSWPERIDGGHARRTSQSCWLNRPFDPQDHGPRFCQCMLPQNLPHVRSCYVNAESMAITSQTRVNNTDELDTIFRAHYERIARVVGRVIHDQARAEELAVEVFLKWWRNPAAHGRHAEGWLYRTAVRVALDELRSQTRRKRFERVIGFEWKSPATPEQLYAVSAERQRVRIVLSALDRRHAELLLLRGEGFSLSGNRYIPRTEPELYR